MATRSWVQNPNPPYNLIPKEEYVRPKTVDGELSAAIRSDIEPFVSPVDGSVIGSSRDLREHNKRNNVVQYNEYGSDHWENSQKRQVAELQGATRQQRHDRVEDIKRVAHRLEHGYKD